MTSGGMKSSGMEGPVRQQQQREQQPQQQQRRWLWPAALVGLAALGLGGVALVRPNLVRNTTTSPRTLLYAALTLLLVVVLGVLVRRVTRSVIAARAAQLVPVLAVLAFVIWPTFVPTTVAEPDPLVDVVALPAVTPNTVTPNAPSVPPTAPPPPAAAAPSGPRELAAATFSGIDHTVTGRASLIDLGDGTSVVRFAEFDVEPGPDYLVYLLDGAGRQRPGGVQLGALKGTRGAQNYAVPAGTTIPATTTVLIWCPRVPGANRTRHVDPLAASSGDALARLAPCPRPVYRQTDLAPLPPPPGRAAPTR